MIELKEFIALFLMVLGGSISVISITEKPLDMIYEFTIHDIGMFIGLIFLLISICIVYCY